MITVKVVIGANAGDEGKGKATDYFVNQMHNNELTLVVLSNGGSQRGHTVTLDDGTRHVFHHLGSGIFSWCDTYFPAGFVLNPMTFVKEMEELGRISMITSRYYVNKNCLVATPFDMIANQLIETGRGNSRHGSCGQGIWETILRNGLTFDQISAMYYADKSHQKVFEYLQAIRDVYFPQRLRNKNISINNDWKKIIYDERLISRYVGDFGVFMDNMFLITDKIPCYTNIVFENGQGLLLDQDIVGYGKNTTPSNTGLKIPAEIIAELGFECDVEVCYVSRSYMTRHGAGRFDTEWDKYKVCPNYQRDLTNNANQFQGPLRYGVLDIDEMINRCVNDFETYSKKGWRMSFMITHIDEKEFPFDKLDGFDVYYSDGPCRSQTHRRGSK